MPIDLYDEEEAGEAEGEALGRARRFTEFDCPECAASNPYDDAFGDGDEVLCYYCGQELKAEVNDSGRLKLKPV